MDHIDGLPYWLVRFDEQGDPDPQWGRTLLSELPGTGVTDLFVFAHGWNNSPQVADKLYRRFFSLVAAELPPARPAIGVLGVVWPSMRWLDEPIPDFPGLAVGGAASTAPASTGPGSTAAAVPALKAVFSAPDQQQALDRIAALLEQRPSDPARLAEFQQLMKTLGEPSAGPTADEDAGELGLVRDDPTAVSERMLDAADRAGSPQDDGGAASIGLLAASPVQDDDSAATGLGGIGPRLWDGAREALRQFTYFTMKRRAGVVGERGLGPLAVAVAGAAPGIRLHLVGHSFGSRLVSFALKGMPARPTPPVVASLTMLEGAFSHFAFASSLSFAPDRGGALAGHAERVEGPIVVVHSAHDTALGVFYPAASLTSQDDAAALDDLFYRWGAMGHDGAQEVGATSCTLELGGRPVVPPGSAVVNVNAGAVVCAGGPPSGAHSDIFHAELARLVLSASGLGDAASGGVAGVVP